MTDLDHIESIDLYEYCGGLYCATRCADGWEHGMLTEPCYDDDAQADGRTIIESLGE